jgi:hypothetical protein
LTGKPGIEILTFDPLDATIGWREKNNGQGGLGVSNIAVLCIARDLFVIKQWLLRSGHVRREFLQRSVD